MESKYDVVDTKKHITKLWNTIGCYTNQDEKLINLFDNISNFKKGFVLEVGPGSGGFAKWLMKKNNIFNYIILDLEKNIYDSKRTLQKYDNVIYINSQDYKNISLYNVDLFVSNFCLSEIPDYYREDIINIIFSKCKYAFVVDGDAKHPTFNTWLKTSFSNNFDIVKVENNIHGNNFMIYGEKQD